MNGQIYVEYQIPKERTQAYPIVIIPGAAQTATNFNGTPDGRDFCAAGTPCTSWNNRDAAAPGISRRATARTLTRMARTSKTASPRRSAQCYGHKPSCTRNGPAPASL